MLHLQTIIISICCSLALLATGTAGNLHATAGAGTVPGVRVLGNRLVDGSGRPLVLRGVDRSGVEYPCVQGWGEIDGPADSASVAAMAAWHINAVRIPLNEDCWLGINGVGGFGGAAYRQAILNYVTLLTQQGMVVILDLHWSAPGATKATGQQPMPDQDHALAFWMSVALTFKSNGDVIFDLFNEPYPQNNQASAAAWQCWRIGCTETSQQGVPYRAIGMQQLVTMVRATGATNAIMVGGIQWAGTVDQWARYRPLDPLHNLIVSLHSYPFSACASVTCWDASIAPLAQQYPVVVGEVGEADCSASYLTSLLPWLDQHGIGYLAWTWSPAFGCESLLSDFNGTPSSPYGQAFKDHLDGTVSASAKMWMVGA